MKASYTLIDVFTDTALRENPMARLERADERCWPCRTEARAVLVAQVALWPERSKPPRHLARTCPPSKRGHEVLISRTDYAASR